MAWRSFPAYVCIATTCFVSACTEPPNKEMDRAQGAIDAARAAGAEQYATTEYSTATAALKNASDAVAAGDYRLALNYALESHEHAQNAARDTANTKARMRADLERLLAELDALIAQGEARVSTAQRARVARRLLTPTADALTSAKASVQKTREVVAEGDYVAANTMLEGVKERVDKALAVLTTARVSQSSRRRQ